MSELEMNMFANRGDYWKAMYKQSQAEKDKAVLEERERLLSSEFLKPYFTHFFYWWYNQQGTNTEQGFDDWYESGNSIANEIRKEP